MEQNRFTGQPEKAVPHKTVTVGVNIETGEPYTADQHHASESEAHAHAIRSSSRPGHRVSIHNDKGEVIDVYEGGESSIARSRRQLA